MEIEKLDIVFEYDSYIVDKNKILYKKEENKYVKIAEIKRHIYRMCHNNNSTYFIDNYGDSYIINENCEFLYGIISKPIFWGIFNNDFITVDNYKRIWIYDIKGELKKILFFERKVEDIIINKNGFTVYLEYGFKKVEVNERYEIINK